jgi:heptosyltransferase II
MLAGIKIRVGFTKGGGAFLHTLRVPYRYGIHEVERNLMLAEAAGWNHEGFVPAIFPDNEDRAAVDTALNGLSGFCVLAPGSVWPTKRWPVEYYITAGSEFAARGIGVVVSGGSGDEDVCGRVSAGIPGSVDICGTLSLRQSAELYRRALFLLTGDTAPQHLAAAAGARVFSLFGPTVKRFGFWPYRENGIVIEDDTVTCRPCGAHGHRNCPEGTHDCMRRLTPEVVLAVIGSHLNGFSETSLRER